MSPATVSGNEFTITCLVNAPRELVWRAWTEPDHVEKWWGPNGFTVTTKEIDIREGGTWRFTMHGPDGRDYPNHIVFTEIVPMERIAHDHGADDGKVHFKAVITFEAQAEKTLVTMRGTFPTAEELQIVAKEHGALEGGEQSLAKMDAYVQTL